MYRGGIVLLGKYISAFSKTSIRGNKFYIIRSLHTENKLNSIHNNNELLHIRPECLKITDNS